jgi:hypothetical protein
MMLGALVLPAALAAIATSVWWPALAHPWLFLALALLSLYGIAAYLMLRQFRDVGISGQPTVVSEAPLQMLRGEAVRALLFFVAAGAAALWILRGLVAWLK